MLKQMILMCAVFFCTSIYGQAQRTVTFHSKENNARHLTQLQIGYMVGASGDIYFFGYNSSPVLQIAHGYQIDKKLALLGSVGIENYKDGVLLPLALNVAVRHKEKQRFQIQMGYSLGIDNTSNKNYQYQGGFLGGVNYGFNLFQVDKLSVFFTVGYEFRRTKLQYNPFDSGLPIQKPLDNHFLALKTGVEF